MKLPLYLAVGMLTFASTYVGAQTVATYPTQADHIAYDPAANLIFESTQGVFGSPSNTVTSVDILTGQPGPTITTGNDPDALAVSSDGQFLYIGVDGDSAIQRYDINSGTLEAEVSLGTVSAGTLYARSIQVLPSQPHSVVVSISNANFSGTYKEVIFDDGVARPNIVTGPNGYDSLAVSPSANIVFGTANNLLSTLSVSANGLAYVHSEAGFGDERIVADPTTGNISDDKGHVVDPTGTTLQGTCYSTFSINSNSVLGSSTGFPSAIASLPDYAHNRIYLLLSSNGPFPTSQGTFLILEEYDATTLKPTGALQFQAGPLTKDLISLGANGVAFTGIGPGNQQTLYTVSGGDLPGLADVTIPNLPLTAQGTITATVTLTSPAPTGGVVVYLNPGPGLSAALSVPASVPVPAGSTFATFQVRSLSANSGYGAVVTSYGAQSLYTGVPVSASGAPALPSNQQIVEQPSNSLVYDPEFGVIYASVPSFVGATGNSIVVFNPATAIIGPGTFVGSEPDSMGVTFDGSSIWTALDGAASIGSYSVANNTGGLAFSLGESDFGLTYAGQIYPVPGSDLGLAVTVLNPGIVAPSLGLALYHGSSLVSQTSQNSNPPDSITQGSTSNDIIGADNAGGDPAKISSYNLTQIPLTPSTTVGNQFGVDGSVIYDQGSIYTSSGKVLNPTTLEETGSFSGAGGFVAPDVEDGAVYFVTPPQSNTQPTIIQAFNPTTFVQIFQTPIPNLVGTVISAIKCGANKIALNTTAGQIMTLDETNISSPGTIYGLVGLMPINAPVPGAAVTLTNVSTNAMATIETTPPIPAPNGGTENYSFSDLLPGTYTLSVTAAGYVTQPSIQVAVGAGTTVDQDLQLGGFHTYASGLQMISSPYVFTSPNQTFATELFGDDSLRLAIWSPSAKSYSVLDGTSTSSLHPGQGYWARFSNQVVLAGANDTQSQSSFTISLSAGWNLIGNPYTNSALISSLLISTLQSPNNTMSFANASNGSSPIVDPFMYTYAAGDTNYEIKDLTRDPNASLAAYQGYWIYAYSNCNLVIPQPPT